MRMQQMVTTESPHADRLLAELLAYSILCAGLRLARPEGLLHCILLESTQLLQLPVVCSTFGPALLAVVCCAQDPGVLHVDAWALKGGCQLHAGTFSLALQIVAKASAFREAPPTRKPSTSSLLASSAAFWSFTEPPAHVGL